MVEATPTKTPDPLVAPNPESPPLVADEAPQQPPQQPPKQPPQPPQDFGCDITYTVPATANPYLAGMPAGTQIQYSEGPPDTAPAQAPVLAASASPNCLASGRTLTFEVGGKISHNNGALYSDANGDLSWIGGHQRGSFLGKSDITAPLNSLIAVFLGDGDPAASSAPEKLSFDSQGSRDYTLLKPKLGQIFYIGNGKTSSGQPHQVIVPDGATHLYFAIMDSFAWYNNLGSLTGKVHSEPTKP